MTRTSALTLVLVFLVPMARAIAAHTSSDDPHRHIRSTDARLNRLVEDGVRGSETFRRLVDRLQRSDVIVYLECGRSAGGRLTFISAVGGRRYVHVRVARLPSADLQIALIGHELQHAVEIADAPLIVDSVSLAREYHTIGYLNVRSSGGLAFDSHAAIDVGDRVLYEMGEKENVGSVQASAPVRRAEPRAMRRFAAGSRAAP